MKKIKITIYISILSLLFTSNAMACDVCGCSLGGNFLGILPMFNKNFIGLRYSRAHFSSTMNHHSDYLENEYSNDTYNKLELWGRYNLSEKIQLYAFVPYSFNDMNGNIQKVKASGMGDISLIGSYKLINTGDDESKKLKHTWMLGGGIKLPTGKHTQKDEGLLINPNFQLGTGSVDFLFNTAYTIRYNKIGLNNEAGYKLNTRNNNDYLFGNQLNFSSNLFYWFSSDNIAILPKIGLYYEHAAKHEDGNIIQVNTGGNALYGNLGLDIYYQNFSLGINYKDPISQQMNSDDIANINANERVSLNFTFNF